MISLALAVALAPANSTASATHQQPPAAAVEASAAVSAETAAALARTVAPADVMIPMEVEQARRAILAMPTVDEEARLTEQEYPGIFDAVWKAMEPEMLRSATAELPGFIAALEQLYRARLTEREAQGLIAFYRSATGQKLLRATYASFDGTAILAEMTKSDSPTIDAKQLQAVTDAAKAKAVQQMGPEDDGALLALAASINLKKAQDLGSETQRISLEWVNKEDPEGDERIAKIMEAATEKYVAAHPAEE
jgi:hypothetical protein